MATLDSRLRALEALPAKEDPKHQERLRAAVAALLDAFSTRANWDHSPGVREHQQQPSDLGALWRRLEAGTATDSDRAALASLPACHLTPEQLVEMVAGLEGRSEMCDRGDTKWRN